MEVSVSFLGKIIFIFDKLQDQRGCQPRREQSVFNRLGSSAIYLRTSFSCADPSVLSNTAAKSLQHSYHLAIADNQKSGSVSEDVSTKENKQNICIRLNDNGAFHLSSVSFILMTPSSLCAIFHRLNQHRTCSHTICRCSKRVREPFLSSLLRGVCRDSNVIMIETSPTLTLCESSTSAQ